MEQRAGVFQGDLEMKEFSLSSPPVRNLINFTPLRYPGGKGKLAAYVKRLLKDNNLLDGQYIEPYAGGAAIALELLFHEYVSEIFINDISQPIYAFWSSILEHTDDFCGMIADTPVDVSVWDKQKAVFMRPNEHTNLELGFATFFLNRTNRSGILNAGIIGGRAQTGPWGIDARLNKDELIFRITSIAKMKHRINLYKLDAIDFMTTIIPDLSDRSLIYLDPPYYKKGRDLYYDFYKHESHSTVAKFVTEHLKGRHWIVSYDNVPEIRDLYSSHRSGVYSIGYSARSHGTGSEVMFFSENMSISPLVGAVKSIEGFGSQDRPFIQGVPAVDQPCV
jgi:DNA adenine methylase